MNTKPRGRPPNAPNPPPNRPVQAFSAARMLSPRSRVAFEVAIGLRPLKEICEQFSISPQQLNHLLKHDNQFREQVRNYSHEWNSSLSAQERVQLKSAIMVEDGLLALWEIFSDPESRDDIKLEVHKHLVKLGAVQPVPAEEAQGSKFAVTINLPPANPADPNAHGSHLTVEAAAVKRLPDEDS